MNKIPRNWMAAAIGAVFAFGFSSCAYDPYYSSASGYYGSGYGDGYGYGSSNFSTSLFVSTGDPRWGYDPYCYSYYDYRSHRYYDPYLYGYYPVGYRPVVVIGAPHPYGWRPGRGYCPPPRTVRNVTVSNYRNRESAYRSSNYSWAKQVRVQPSSQVRGRSQSPSRSTYGSPASTSRTSPYGSDSSSSRPNYQPRSSTYSGSTVPSTRSTYGTRQSSENFSPSRSRGVQSPSGTPNSHQQRSSRIPSAYNTPVTGTPSRQSYSSHRESGSRTQYGQPTQPATQSRPPVNRPPAQPSYQRGGNGNSNERSPSNYDRKRAIKGLGQG